MFPITVLLCTSSKLCTVIHNSSVDQERRFLALERSTQQLISGWTSEVAPWLWLSQVIGAPLVEPAVDLTTSSAFGGIGAKASTPNALPLSHVVDTSQFNIASRTTWYDSFNRVATVRGDVIKRRIAVVWPSSHAKCVLRGFVSDSASISRELANSAGLLEPTQVMHVCLTAPDEPDAYNLISFVRGLLFREKVHTVVFTTEFTRRLNPVALVDRVTWNESSITALAKRLPFTCEKEIRSWSKDGPRRLRLASEFTRMGDNFVRKSLGQMFSCVHVRWEKLVIHAFGESHARHFQSRMRSCLDLIPRRVAQQLQAAAQMPIFFMSDLSSLGTHSPDLRGRWKERASQTYSKLINSFTVYNITVVPALCDTPHTLQAQLDGYLALDIHKNLCLLVDMATCSQATHFIHFGSGGFKTHLSSSLVHGNTSTSSFEYCP